MVMLHGWPQHWYEWRHLIPSLSRRYRVICPDLRGLGWTDAPPGGYEKEELASDVLALLDALELDRVKLVGHDWGGWVGYLICLREPARVERYLALNIVPPFLPFDPRQLPSIWRLWYQWVIASPVLGPWAVRQVGSGNPIIRWVGGGPAAWSEDERETFLGQLREPERARASVQYYRAFQLREVGPVLRGRYRRQRLHTPTLILFGTGDRVQQARALEDASATRTSCASSWRPGSATSSPTSAPTSSSTARCRSSRPSPSGERSPGSPFSLEQEPKARSSSSREAKLARCGRGPRSYRHPSTRSAGRAARFPRAALKARRALRSLLARRLPAPRGWRPFRDRPPTPASLQEALRSPGPRTTSLSLKKEEDPPRAERVSSSGLLVSYQSSSARWTSSGTGRRAM